MKRGSLKKKNSAKSYNMRMMKGQAQAQAQAEKDQAEKSLRADGDDL